MITWDINITTIGVSIAYAAAFYLGVSRGLDRIKGNTVRIEGLEKNIEAMRTTRETTLHSIGETITAIREFVNLELRAMASRIGAFENWTRDEFVRKNTFETILERMERDQTEWRKSFADDIREMDGKIDKLLSR